MTDRDAILDQVTRHGLTIPVLAAKRLGVHRDLARRLLDTLVGERVLCHYPYGRAVYYTRARQPLSARVLRERFAVAWFCEMGATAKTLLTVDELAPLLEPVLAALGLAALPRIPTYYDQATGRTHAVYVPHELRSGRTSHLDATLRALQRFVTTPAFRPWLYLCSKGRGGFAYLHPEPSQVDELRRWLARHPVMPRFDSATPGYAHLPTEALVVPVEVEALRVMRPQP